MSEKFNRGKFGNILFYCSIGLFVLTILIAIGIYADTGNSALSFTLIKILCPVSVVGFVIGLVNGSF